MEPPSHVPFNVPHVEGKEFEYISEALRSRHLSGDGAFSRRCHAFLEEYLGCEKALLTTSCTDALEMSALLLDLQPGDEVIVPSFTFVSTANAFAIHGATPVFADVDPETLNIDPAEVQRHVTSRTRAVVAVHYAGFGCDVEALRRICDVHDLLLIEDNAHGLGGRVGDRRLGSIGDLATQSFHETKNVQCGEGGALIINTPAFADRAEVLREKGTNRSAFFRGQIDKYTWVDYGSSFLLSDLQAAFLWAQLEALDDINTRRMTRWEGYASRLADWAATEGVSLPSQPSDRIHPAHLFHLLLPSPEERTVFLKHMKSLEVDAPFHYVPLHTSPGGQRFGRTEGCPVTEDVSARLVRLPLYPSLTDSDHDRVVEVVTSYRTGHA